MNRDQEIQQLEEQVEALLKRIDLLKQLRAMEAGGKHLSYNRFAGFRLLIQAAEACLQEVNIPLSDDDLLARLTMGGFRDFRNDPEAARYSFSQSMAWNIPPKKGEPRLRRGPNGDKRIGLASWLDEKWLTAKLS